MRHIFPLDWNILTVTHPDQLRVACPAHIQGIIITAACWQHTGDLYASLTYIAQHFPVQVRVYVQTFAWWRRWWLPYKRGYPVDDIMHIGVSAGYQVVGVRRTTRTDSTQTGSWLERLWVATPGIGQWCPYALVCLARIPIPSEPPSVAIIVPCKNEAGNIEQAVQEIPLFAGKTEIIFVIGASQDGSLSKAHEVAATQPDRAITVVDQKSKGKKAGVWEGIAVAQSDIIIIYDGDITVAGTQLSAVYEQFAQGRAEFINGSRLVYPVPKGAMPWLNQWVNRMFALIFSQLLAIRLTDTLCGTKAWWARDTRIIESIRQLYGDQDPFGDFDLLCGAVYHYRVVREIALSYRPRSYGVTQISYWRDGWILLRISWRIWINYGMGYFTRTPH